MFRMKSMSYVLREGGFRCCWMLLHDSQWVMGGCSRKMSLSTMAYDEFVQVLCFVFFSFFFGTKSLEFSFFIYESLLIQLSQALMMWIVNIIELNLLLHADGDCTENDDFPLINRGTTSVNLISIMGVLYFFCFFGKRLTFSCNSMTSVCVNASWSIFTNPP